MAVTMADRIAGATSGNELSSLLASDKFGIYPAKGYLKIDGVTDDYQKLYDLINTTINGDDAEIWFPDGTCIIGTSITIPSNINIKFLEGAMLKPSSGVVITGDNAKIEAGLQKIFDLSASGGTGVAGSWDIPEAYPEWFGAVGDGSTDDSTALQYLSDFCLACDVRLSAIKGKSYNVDSQVSFRKINDIDFRSEIIVGFVGVGIVIGGSSSTNIPKTQYFYTVKDTNDTEPANPLIRVSGSKSAIIKVDRCKYVQLYADGDDTTTISIAYSSFYLANCAKLELTNNAAGTGSQFINENTFYGGRFTEIDITGNYNHNNNIFYRPTLESCDLNIDVGYSNFFYDCRFELGGTITFGSDAHSNLVTQSYSSNLTDDIQDLEPTITDNGQSNIFCKSQFAFKDAIDIFSINNKTKIYDDSSEYGTLAKVTPGLDKLELETPNGSTVYWTDFIPVINGSQFRIKSDAVIWKFYIFLYDENMDQIEAESDPSYISMASKSWNTTLDAYLKTGNNSEYEWTMTSATPKYMKVQFLVGTSVDKSFRYLNFVMYQRKREDIINMNFTAKKGLPILASSPTEGFALKGELVSNSAGGVFVCTKSLETTLDGTVAASGTSVTVTDNTDVANGDIVGILLDDGLTHWTTVSGLSGSTFTVDALPSQASDNNKIVFNLWT